MPRTADFIDPRDWAVLLSHAYAGNLPPIGVIRQPSGPHDWKTQANGDYLLDSVRALHAQDCRAAGKDRLIYIRRFKGKKALAGDKKVAERLVYHRFFDTAVADRGANGVDSLLAALDIQQTSREQSPPGH
eukprot:jgi/Tetstr1/441299/TSEL_029550.t1